MQFSYKGEIHAVVSTSSSVYHAWTSNLSKTNTEQLASSKAFHPHLQLCPALHSSSPLMHPLCPAHHQQQCELSYCHN
eukprot:8270863-Ditylum_brightwellii.AAC.1